MHSYHIGFVLQREPNGRTDRLVFNNQYEKVGIFFTYTEKKKQ